MKKTQRTLKGQEIPIPMVPDVAVPEKLLDRADVVAILEVLHPRTP